MSVQDIRAEAPDVPQDSRKVERKLPFPTDRVESPDGSRMILGAFHRKGIEMYQTDAVAAPSEEIHEGRQVTEAPPCQEAYVHGI